MDLRGGIERLPSVLEGVIARINTLWNKQHTLAGGHSNVTATKITADELDIGDYKGAYTAHKGKPLLGTGKQNTQPPDFTSALSIGRLILIGDQDAMLSSAKRVSITASQDIYIQILTGSNLWIYLDPSSVSVNGRLNAYKNPHAINSEGDTHGALVLTTRSEPVDQRKWRIINYMKELIFDRVNDAENAIVDGPRISFSPAGVINAAGLGSTPINGANIIPGTLPSTPLPANVAYTNVNNNFSAAQTMPSGGRITGSFGLLDYYDTDAPVDNRWWRFLQYHGGNFILEGLSDAGGVLAQYKWSRAGTFETVALTASGAVNSASVVSTGLLQGTHLEATPYHMRSGTGCYAGTDFYEKGRTTPVGHWIAPAHNAGNFYALGPMTWAVAAASMVGNAYTLIGQTMIWNVYVVNTTLGGTVTNSLYVNTPTGLACQQYDIGIAQLYIPGEGWVPGTVTAEPGVARVLIQKHNGANFAAVGACHVRFSITLRLA